MRRGFILAAVTWQLAAVLFLGSAVVPMALAQDSEAPLLVDFDFNPKSIDVSSGPADVTCTMAATDDLSGLDFALCLFSLEGISPPAYGCYVYPPSTTECSFSIPQYVEEGTWRPLVRMEDNVENVVVLSSADLEASGFPNALEIGFRVGSPLATIATPSTGKRVRGNSVTIKAELAQGSPDEVSPTLGVRFDYRLLPSGIFAPVPARNANHPNPDTTYPYFTHWDVSGVADGDYELRAVAHDLGDVPDPAPETITITIDHIGAVDIDENLKLDGVQETRTGLDDSTESQVGSGDWTETSTAAELVVPPGALVLAADTAILNFPHPSLEEPMLDPSERGIGAFVAVELESGQAAFESGMTSDLVVSYSDADQDGFVDGTGIPEDTLELRYYDATADAYVPMPGWTVMTEHNQVHSGTTFTGKFGIVPEPSFGMLLLFGAAGLLGLSMLKGSV